MSLNFHLYIYPFPFQRYFFHATETRQLEDDYDLHDSDSDDAIKNASDNPPLEEIAVPVESSQFVEEGTHDEWLEGAKDNESTLDSGVIREAPEEETLDYDSDNRDIHDDDTEPSDTDETGTNAVLNVLQDMVTMSFSAVLLLEPLLTSDLKVADG